MNPREVTPWSQLQVAEWAWQIQPHAGRKPTHAA
jgi:hypothetical protein